MQTLPVEETTPLPQKRSRLGCGLAVFGGLLLLSLLVAAGAFFYLRDQETKYIETGRAAITAGEWENAEVAASLALGLQPAFVRQHVTEATALRGVARYQQGDDESALTDLDAAIAADPDLVDLYAYRSNLHYRQGNHERALADSETALAQEDLLPDYLRASLHTNRAMLYIAAGSSPEQINEEIEAALALADHLPDERLHPLYVYHAQQAFNNGDETVALADTASAVASAQSLYEGSLLNLYNAQTALYYEQGNYEAALKAVDAAVSVADNLDFDLAIWEHSHILRADILFQLGDLSTAIIQAEDIVNKSDHQALISDLEENSPDDEAALTAAKATLARPHAWRALKNYREGNWELALAEAEAALEWQPENPIAAGVRGSLRTWQGNFSPAIEDLTIALAANPADVELLALRLYCYLELEEIEAAEADLNQAIAANPAAPTTLWAQAMNHYYNYDTELAHVLLDQAIALDNSRAEFYAFRSLTYRQTADREQAAADARQALSLRPDFPLALETQLNLHSDEVGYDGIEPLLNHLLETWPDYYAGYTQWSTYAYYYQQDFAAAKDYIDQAIALQPEISWLYALRANLYLQEEDFAAAHADIDHALELNPDSFFALSALSDWHWNQDQQAEAIELTEQTVALAPNSFLARFSLAQLHYFSGSPELAWQQLHALLADDPDYPAALILKAIMLGDAGQTSPALRLLNTALDTSPADGYGVLVRASFHLQNGDLAEARLDAERALELEPTLVDAHRLLAEIALGEEDYETALTEATTLIETGGANAHAYFLQGIAHYYLQELDEAVTAFTAGLEAEQSADLLGTLYFNRQLVYREMGETELARADLEAILAGAASIEDVSHAESELAFFDIVETRPDGWLVYTDNEETYSIAYPPHWQQFLEDQSETDSFVVFLETDAGYADVFVELISEAAGLTLRQYADAVNQSIDQENEVDILSTESTTVGDYNALVTTMELTTREGGRTILMRLQLYYLIQHGTGVLITVRVPQSDWNDVAADVEAIIATFTFLADN